jgi:HEPN domain-containing protein
MDAHSLKRKRIDAFLTLSLKDVTVARKLLPDFAEHAAFNMQQAVEKMIRAVLEHEQIVAGNSHNIRQLAELLPNDHLWREKFDAMDHLSSSATRFRYPTSTGNILQSDDGITSHDLADIETMLRDVRAWLLFRV